MPRSKGHSLLEVMLVAGLLMLVLSALVSLLVPTLRAWMRSAQQAEAQQSAAVVVARLRAELQRARPQSLGCLADRLVFYSWSDSQGQLRWDSQARVLWQRTVTVYFDSDLHEVRLQERAIAPVPNPAALPGDFSPDPQDRVIARNILSLGLTCPPGGPLDVRVEAAVGDQHHVLITAVAPLEAPGLDQ